MTTPSESGTEKRFATSLLPKLVAGGALLIYLLTINHWISVQSLGLVAQVGNWNWPQHTLPPLLFLATYPFHWLPTAWLPLGLNLFSAVCGALSLGLLARSVAILPRDRTEAQREREHSNFAILSLRTGWVPVVFAAVACGLQLTFWENAVAASDELLNLLLFAFIVWNILEFRIDARESRLAWATFVYGLAMANNWLMIVLLPVYLLALLGSKKLAFFNVGFLLRMFGLGVAGMLAYLLMPLVQYSEQSLGLGFWELVWFNMTGQKDVLFSLPYQSLWMLALPSLLPALLMVIRWKAFSGETSALGMKMTGFMFHVIHAIFLVVCTWIAFDPPISPRIYPKSVMGANPSSWLPLYYLSALSVGYCSGYFLLIFGKASRSRRRRNAPPSPLNPVVVGGIWALLGLTTAGLLWKNLPLILRDKDAVLQKMAARMTAGLAADNVVVLSDDQSLLMLTEAGLPRQAGKPGPILINSVALKYPAYHQFLLNRYAGRWQDNLATNDPNVEINDVQLYRSLAQAAQNHTVYYLHPSFGYYFERFYQEAQGLVFSLNEYATNAINPPALTPAGISENEEFWKAGDLKLLAEKRARETGKDTGIGAKLRQLLQISSEPDWNAQFAGNVYSRALDSWGVTLQRNDRLDEAAAAFQFARELNPNNVAAQVNLTFNEALRKGTNAPVVLGKSLESRLGQYKTWAKMVDANGPVDEPQFCYQEGVVFIQNHFYRQAAQQFERVTKLYPDNPASYLWLGQIYNLIHLPDRALEMAQAARERKKPSINDSEAGNVDLWSVEATAYFAKNDQAAGNRLLDKILAATPKDGPMLNFALQLYMSSQQYTNALAIIDRQLKQDPDSPTALNNKGFVNVRLENYEAAIPPLTRLLEMQPTNTVALLNRAIANLRSNHLDEAERDYLVLERLHPSAYQIYYGLGEVAYRQKDTAAAIDYYQRYLSNAPPNTAESSNVLARMQELKSRSP